MAKEVLPNRPKAVIIGGGVAGLTVAHELQERGFRVTVYEKNKNSHPGEVGVALGGKARSFPVHANNAVGWDRDFADKAAQEIVHLPAEHGFRFFPGFYRHVIDTLRRIPSGNGKTVFDNLVEIEHAAYALEGRAMFRFGARRPETLRQIWKGLRRLFLQNPTLGLTPMEAAFAASKIINGMTMCEERREVELEHVPWADYMHSREMSGAYRAVVVNGLTQNFVAMDAELSSTKTAITIIARLLNDWTTPGRTLDRVFNGPTSEVWFDHWKRYLRKKEGVDPHSKVGAFRRKSQEPVKFKHAQIASLRFDPASNRIVGINVEQKRGEPPIEEPPDDPQAFYVLAVPVESAAKILEASAEAEMSPEIFVHSPSLKSIKNLKVNWMVGLVYYLKSDVEMCPGHINYVNSRWAITSISQNQFWKEKIERRWLRENLRPEVTKTFEKENRNWADAPEGKGKDDEGDRLKTLVNKALEDRLAKEEKKKESDRKVPAVKGVLSVILSDWDKPGIRNNIQTAKEAEESFEVGHEALWQIRVHLQRVRSKDAPRNDRDTEQLNRRDDRLLEDDNIVGFTLDPAVLFTRLRRRMSAGEVVNHTKIEAREFAERQAARDAQPKRESGQADTAPKDYGKIRFRLDGDPMVLRLAKSFQSSAAWSPALADAESSHAEAPLVDPSEFLDTLPTALQAMENKEPMFINTVNSSALRPTAVTGIENLFLASDYIKTKTDLATMEGANEAARRAVNGILQALQSKRTLCTLYSFEEPAVLAPFKAMDKHLFALGLPHPSFLVDPVLSFGAKFTEGAQRWFRSDDTW